MRKIIIQCFLTLVLISFGCATVPGYRYEWKIEPFSQHVENEYISLTLAPDNYRWGDSPGYTAFKLSVKNKTTEDIELDWNKTLYIQNGQSNGGFMFEGIIFRDRNNPKLPDIIFAKTEFIKTIWPNNLIFLDRLDRDWGHEVIPPGLNGIYITVRVRGKEINEKVILNMLRIRVQS